MKMLKRTTRRAMETNTTCEYTIPSLSLYLPLLSLFAPPLLISASVTFLSYFLIQTETEKDILEEDEDIGKTSEGETDTDGEMVNS